MGYKNGIAVLPTELIAQIQKYVDGEYIYIPRAAEKRRKWGETNASREALSRRNAQIYARYVGGASVRQLSEEYYISRQGIYKIIAKYK